MNPRALRAFAAAAALALVATACSDDDDPIAPDDEPDTTRIVLTVSSGAGTQAITWNTENGSVAPGNITIPAGQSRTVTAQFFRADNSQDPIIDAVGFRLDFNVTGGTGVTVTKNGNLAATITAGATAGQSVTLTLALFHLEEGHEEYESSPGALTVTVQ